MTDSAPRILVVEDSAMVRELTCELLRDGGFHVTEAEDGVQGLELARSTQPDVIFSDIQMPNMDGIEMCRQLKASAATAEIPVIFLSTLDAMDDLMRGLQVGAADYLSKRGDGDSEILKMAQTYADKVRAKRGTAAPSATSRPAASPAPVERPAHLPFSWLDHVNVGFLVLDLARTPMYANAKASAILGGPADRERVASFVAALVDAMQREPGGGLVRVAWRGASVLARVDPAYSERGEICALLVFVAAADGAAS